jgi:E3 ubiquitin-protein ligase ATL4
MSKESGGGGGPTLSEQQILAGEVAAARGSWLREYVDRLSASLSSRTASFRGSGRFFTGSSRRSEIAGVGDYDLEANRVGEEISELFRWFSGV